MESVRKSTQLKIHTIELAVIECVNIAPIKQVMNITKIIEMKLIHAEEISIKQIMTKAL